MVRIAQSLSCPCENGANQRTEAKHRAISWSCFLQMERGGQSQGSPGLVQLFRKPMKSERHFFATLNYVHNNPVHHGYVKRWQDWPWSSASEFLDRMGHEKAKEIWLRYPFLGYGKTWD